MKSGVFKKLNVERATPEVKVALGFWENYLRLVSAGSLVMLSGIVCMIKSELGGLLVKGRARYIKFALESSTNLKTKAKGNPAKNDCLTACASASLYCLYLPRTSRCVILLDAARDYLEW